jgi:uncharacterized protein YcfL
MKKLFSFVMVLLLLIALVGCGSSTSEPVSNSERVIHPVDITNAEQLIYDTNTGIVYLQQRTYSGHYIYTLYLSENGLPYKYINGELIEVK